MIQVLVNSLAAAAAYTLVGIGFGLIYSTGRFFHFAHGAIYTLAAYAAYTVSASLGFGWWAGLICGAIFAAIVGGLIEITIYRPMRRRKANPTILFLASLGVLVVIQNTISLAYGEHTYVLRNRSVDRVYEFFGAMITLVQIEMIVVAAILCLIVWAFLHLTGLGYQIRATANDPDLARIVGIKTDRVLLTVFVLGSVLAGVAAILFAQETDIRSNMGTHVLMISVVAIIVGGMDSIPGTALGALLVAFARNITLWFLPAQWGDAIAFSLLIVFLLWRPQGFMGKPILRVAS